jgi:hypothetical protein
LRKADVFLKLHGDFFTGLQGNGWRNLQFTLHNALAAAIERATDLAGGLLLDGRSKPGLIPGHAARPDIQDSRKDGGDAELDIVEFIPIKS